MKITIIFDDNTDYEIAETTVKQMYSDMVSSKCSCKCKKDVESRVTSLLTAIDIDKDTNESRWKNNIRIAYKFLKSYCGC